MCLINYCPEGTDKYSEKVIKFIKRGANTNRDGSGYMFKRKGEKTITIDKGYFVIEDMIESMLAHDLQPEDELVIHHRIGTSGKNSPENTHPFILTNVISDIAATSMVTKKPCLMHNGVFKGLYSYMRLNDDFSDTYALSRYILSNKNVLNILDTDKGLFETIMNDILNYSRLIIMYPDKDTKMIGKWHEDEGYFHSNTGYCDYWERSDYGYGSQGWNNRNHNAGSSVGNTNFGGRNEFLNSGKSTNDDNKESLKGLLPRLGELTDKGSNGKEKTVTTFYCKPLGREINMMVLDRKTVKITEDNFRHFYYISVEDYNKSLPNGDFDIAEIDIFSDVSLKIQLVERELLSEDDIRRIGFGESRYITKYSSIHWSELNTLYYYIPKEAYYEIYSDYLKLIMLIGNDNIGKNTIKKVEDKLKQNNTKPEGYKIKYTRGNTKDTYCKHSLELLKGYLEFEQSLSNSLKSKTKAVEEDINNNFTIDYESAVEYL